MSKEIPCTLIGSFSCVTEHLLKYKVKGKPIFLEIVTKISKRTGEFGKSKGYWYHEDDPKTHDTYEEAAKFKPIKESKK